MAELRRYAVSFWVLHGARAVDYRHTLDAYTAEDAITQALAPERDECARFRGPYVRLKGIEPAPDAPLGRVVLELEGADIVERPG